MIVINTLSDTKFSFNGITYHKNFMPFVTGDKIAILNVYDACIALTDAPTHFSEYVVNGVTYTSVETLQAALLDVIYTRVSLGSGGSGTVTSVSGTGTVSGITLSGTVTTSGSLTLGGTLSLTSGQVTTALGFTPYDATNPAGYITSSALTGYVTLGTAQTITAAKTFSTSGGDNTFAINHSSGSGIGLSITKGGNGEGLYVNKTSGSGNAATIIGTLNATTLVKNGGTSSQFLKADGSVDSSVYLTSASLEPLEFNITDRTVWNNGKSNVVTNTSFGEFALRNNSTGDWNTSYGYQALTTNVGGSKNTAIGMNAISSAGSGSFNTAIGANAGALKLGGTILQIVENSVFVGYNSRALDDNQTNQIVIGANATGNGSNSVTLGNDSITKTILKGNVGLGVTPSAWFSGWKAVEIGSGNAIWTVSGQDFRISSNLYNDGSNNIYKANGAASFYNQGSGTHNWYTAPSGTAGNAISFTQAMTLDASGNLGIGTTSPSYLLDVVKSGTNAIRVQNTANTSDAYFIAQNTGGSTFFGINATGPYIYTAAALDFTLLTNNTERMRITSSGYVLVGQTTIPAAFGDTVGVAIRPTGAILAVADNNISGLFSRKNIDGDVILFRKDTTTVGSISVTGSLTSYNVTSDYRLKQDLKNYNGLNLINNIKTYDYEWKSDKSRMHGVLAHELQEVLPYAVTGEKDDERMQSVDYSKLVPVLVKAIQELTEKVKQLENK